VSTRSPDSDRNGSVRLSDDDGRVQHDRWQRWSPLAGVAFAVLFLAALGVSTSGPNDTPEEVTRYYRGGLKRMFKTSPSSTT